MKIANKSNIQQLSDYNNGVKYSKLYLYYDLSPGIRTKIIHEFSYRFNCHKNTIINILLNNKIKK